MKYQHIIFDLDHTLWDFDRNAQHVLERIYDEYLRLDSGVSFDDFSHIYQQVNHKLWDKYHHNLIDQQTIRLQRFCETFELLNIDPNLLDLTCVEFDQQFVDGCALMDGVFPYCHQVLERLSKHYHLHILTNGFSEVQHRKLASSKLDSYFEQVFISEQIGVNKPAPGIFQHAMNVLDTEREACLMIGDNLEADINGAKGVGMDQVWFNPKLETVDHQATYEVNCLSELIPILLPENDESEQVYNDD